MNHLFSLSALILLTSFAATAQIDVETTVAPDQSGTPTVFSVNIPQTTLKSTEKPWLHYIGKGSKGKCSSDNGQFLQLGAVNKNIYHEPFEVRSTLVEAVNGVRVSAWFTKNGEPLAAKKGNGEEHFAEKKYLHDFAVKQYRSAIEDELEDEKDKLSDLEKTMKAIVKEGVKSGKTISENTRSGQRTSDAMTISENDIVKQTDKIEGQNDMLDATASDPNASKGANKTMDEMKDDKKDLEKLNESQGQDLDDLNADTQAAQRNSMTLQQRQEATQMQIDAQRGVVRQVEAKLAAIK
jgi:hypothetical protein